MAAAGLASGSQSDIAAAGRDRETGTMNRIHHARDLHTRPVPALPTVHAVILAYNDCAAVVRCLESLSASTHDPLTICLVDNASRDSTVPEVQSRFPACRIYRNHSNLGFAAGCNVGIQHALAEGAEHVLVLNQDTVVDAHLVARLATFLDTRPEAAAVGPLTYFLQHHPDGQPRILYAGAWRTWLPLRQRIPGIERPDPGHPRSPVRVDYVWGHGMMVRAACLREVGLFDPAFFMYYEDLDLCRRLTAAGYQIWCEPRAVMWHDITDGARARESELWRWRLKARSSRYFHGKHYGTLVASALEGLTVLSEAQRLLGRKRFKATMHMLRTRAYIAGNGRPVATQPEPGRT